MKKGLKNSLLALGLAGILAGCQNPTYWSVTNQRGQTTINTRPVVSNPRDYYVFERENFHNYKEQDKIEIPVKELKVFSVQDVTTKTTPIYTINWTAQQKPNDLLGIGFRYTVLSGLSVGILPTIDTLVACGGNFEKTEFYGLCKNASNQTRVPGTERAYSKTLERNEVFETKGQPSIKKQINPAKNFPVETTGKGIKINGRVPPSTVVTDNEGILHADFSPVNGFARPFEAEEYARGILEETYKTEKLRELIAGLSLYETRVEPFSLKTKDDELKLTYTSFIPIDNRTEINSRIKSKLEDYLKRKFPLKEIELIVREKGNRNYLDDILLESKQIKGVTFQTVNTEQRIFLDQFFKHPADELESCVDPKRFVSSLSEQLKFNKHIKITVNEDSEYSCEFMHLYTDPSNKHDSKTEIINVQTLNGTEIELESSAQAIKTRQPEKDEGLGRRKNF